VASTPRPALASILLLPLSWSTLVVVLIIVVFVLVPLLAIVVAILLVVALAVVVVVATVILVSCSRLLQDVVALTTRRNTHHLGLGAGSRYCGRSRLADRRDSTRRLDDRTGRSGLPEEPPW